MSPRNASDVSRALARRIDSLCIRLFPQGRKSGHEWRVGSLDGEPGQSLAVHLSGARAGVWSDFATGDRGDALDLVREVLQLGTRDAISWSCEWLGSPIESIAGPARDAAPAKTIESNADAARRAEYHLRCARAIWKEAQPIAGTLAETYLRDTRRIAIDRWPPSVRFHPRLRYSMRDGSCLYLPAIVLPVQQSDGAFCGVWRSYLDPDKPTKANVEFPRRGLGNIQGGAVRLTPIAAEMTIGEGLETCLSVLAADRDRAVMMALSASLMRRLRLPQSVRRVVLLEENDKPDQRGRRASPDAVAALSATLLTEGRSVSIARTPAPFKDLNDVLRAQQQPVGASHAA